MSWLNVIDSSVIVALVVGGSNILTQLFDGKNKKLGKIINKLDNIEDGTLKTLRYRLFHDLRAEIEKGETSFEHFRELSILFASYRNLGGNGEIEVLFKKYSDLPIKED